jgi:hypothetical protein
MDLMIRNVDPAIRDRAKARARSEGRTFRFVVSNLLERYAAGEIEVRPARFATEDEFKRAADAVFSEHDKALKRLAE